MGVHELSVSCEILHTDEGIDSVSRLDAQEILQCTTLGILSTFGDLIYLEPVATPHLGEEEHRLVHRSRIDVLDEIFVSCIATLSTYTATSL